MKTTIRSPVEKGMTTKPLLSLLAWMLSVSVEATENSPPVITGQPTFQIVCEGHQAIFILTATGTGLNFQWRKNGVNLAEGPTGNGSNYGGATTETLTTLIIIGVTVGDAAPAEAGFDCVVSGTGGPPVISTRVGLAVDRATIAVTVQPTNQTVCPGATATFNAAASGGLSLTAQWQVWVARSWPGRSEWTDIPGATNTVLSFTPTTADNGKWYRALFSNSCGSSVGTDQATFTISRLVTIPSGPASATMAPGDRLTFSVLAAGTEPFSYQWRKGGSPIAGATNAYYMFSPVTVEDAGDYDVVVSGACGSTAASSVARLTVEAPMITISVSDTAVVEEAGGTTNAVFAVSLSGPSVQVVKVDYATAGDTAISGVDFTPASGTLTFDPGETDKTITVSVIGDKVDEPDETLFVNLSNPVNAAIAKGQGVGVILDTGLPAIRISDLFTTTAGAVGFKVAGAEGQRVIVQGCEDLSHWENLHTNIVAGGAFIFKDDAATALRQRFYRAMTP